MQNHVWISLAWVCLFCQAIRNSNGCSSRKLEISNKKLLLRPNWDNVTKPEILTAISANDCAQLCCEKNSRCNLAAFHSSMAKNNCIHAYCHPVSECLRDKADKSNGDTATYQLVELERGTGPRSIRESTKQSATSQLAPRSIKSRKGVGETATIVNASFAEKLESVGTDAPTDTPTEEPVAATSDITSTAQPLDPGSTTVSVSTLVDGTVEATLIEDSTAKTDFPDLDANKIKHIVPRKGASAGRSWAPYSTPSTPLQPMDQQPRPPIPTKQIQSNNRSFSTGKNATEFTTKASSTADRPNATHTNHENLPKDYKTSMLTTIFLSATSAAAQDDHNKKSAKYVILESTSSKQPPLNVLVSGSIDFLSSRTTIVAAQNLDDLHFQQSIYLIVSLIIGFLVLLLVVGMVLKHVYGVWERRHYQRMDFLIDGLYNSRSAI